MRSQALESGFDPDRQVTSRRGAPYARVPQVLLQGAAERWQAPPTAYPKIAPGGSIAITISQVADPSGEYQGLREGIRW
jgi:hypothetical protein